MRLLRIILEKRLNNDIYGSKKISRIYFSKCNLPVLTARESDKDFIFTAKIPGHNYGFYPLEVDKRSGDRRWFMFEADDTEEVYCNSKIIYEYHPDNDGTIDGHE